MIFFLHLDLLFIQVNTEAARLYDITSLLFFNIPKTKHQEVSDIRLDVSLVFQIPCE